MRRLPLPRLLLLCGLVVAVGVGATALAFALGTGPTPPPASLADAIHGALVAPAVEGVTANVQLTNHLLEGANLAAGEPGSSGSSGGKDGSLASNPLLSGASGRLWVANGKLRLELQAEEGDTEIVYDGDTLSVYDAASNTLYRYTPPRHGTPEPATRAGSGEVPSVAEIEAKIAKLSRHATVSGATPTDIAGQAAYAVRLSPTESGSLIGGAELSFDAVHGIPLRAAIYSSTSPSPVIELAASSISYGPIAASTIDFTPPANAKLDEIKQSEKAGGENAAGDGEHPKLTVHGRGLTAIGVVEAKAHRGGQLDEGLPQGVTKVKINGASGAELTTALGTLLSYERSGVDYLLAGSVTPASLEELARGL